MEFFIDGDLIATDSETPFETEWNTTESSDGEHTLQCKAIDDFDNETKSSNVEVRVVNALFTANFTNDWLCADCGDGILFISDMDGNVLGEATWTGNAGFTIDLPEGLTDLSQKISVTTVVNYNLDYTELRTYLFVDIGSSWTWGKASDRSENSTEISLDFSNLPDHKGFAISSPWNVRISSNNSIYTPYFFNIYENPTDVYLKLNALNSGSKFKWINNVTEGSYQVDLSTMSDPESKTIDLNGESLGYRKFFYGFPNPGSRYTGRYTLDYNREADQLTTSVNVYYPPSTFSDFRTSLFFYDSEPNDYWYQSIYGDIPNTFEKIDADFDFISTTPNDFQITATTTNFDQITSRWEQMENNKTTRWWVWGPQDLSDYTLPTFPNSVASIYPDLERELFELISADLRDHSELNSYEEILDLQFKSPDGFYDVVNDLRTRLKYYGSKKSADKRFDFEMEDEYFNQY